MPRPSSSYGAERSRLAACAALAGILSLAGGARPAAAAPILEKSPTFAIQPGGGVNERVRIAVRLDSAQDLANWSPYPIFLDENRKLVDLTAFATQPDGKVVKVGRKGLDTAE